MIASGIKAAGRQYSSAERASDPVYQSPLGKPRVNPINAITSAKETQSSRPGRMPARNISPMGTCASTPKITNIIEGGITGASKPPAAVVATAKPLS